MYELTLNPGELTLTQLRRISREQVALTLSKDVKEVMQSSTDTVTSLIEEGRVVYGINTGFGLLANTRIATEDLETLQRSIVLSHAAGIGTFMRDETVRLMMVLKVNSLARGYSGIRFSVVQALVGLINAEVYPCIPEKGL